jgi:hypothetical protein
MEDRTQGTTEEKNSAAVVQEAEGGALIRGIQGGALIGGILGRPKPKTSVENPSTPGSAEQVPAAAEEHQAE